MIRPSALPRLFFVIAGSLAFVAVTRAQQPAQTAPAKPEPPQGQLLVNAPDFSRWVVDYTYPEDRDRNAAASMAPAVKARPRRTILIKTREILSSEIIDVGGRTTRRWYSGSTQYSKRDGEALWGRSGPSGPGSATDFFYVPMPANGFPDFDLVSAENYAGVAQYGGVAALVFLHGGSNKINLADVKEIAQLASQPVVAYIDAKSRLPLGLKIGGEQRKYTFLTPPSAMQVLPPDLAAEIKKGEDGRARLNQPAPRPY